MEDELNLYEDIAVAKDRLNTLASVLFSDAELNCNGNDLSFSSHSIKPLLKAWFPESYGATLNHLKGGKEEETDNE